jgi:murein DD-endopeptidase MepM/ murein hydrolase activator NlpD
MKRQIVKGKYIITKDLIDDEKSMVEETLNPLCIFCYKMIGGLALVLILLITIFNLSWRYKLAMETIQNKNNELCQVSTENMRLKDSLAGIGGGEAIPEDNIDFTSNMVKWWIANHGLLKYHWKYDIGYPVYNPSESYVRSEKGKRIRNGKWEDHKGIDINSKWDLRVIAVSDGKIEIKQDRYRGLYLELTDIKDDNIITSRYCHLSKVYVESLKTVKKGDIIALIGNSGDSDGSHLHFELEINGVIVNPVSTSTFNKVVVE